MKLTREDLVHLAKLSALPLTDEELARFEHDLQRIVGHVETLLAVDVEGISPTLGVRALAEHPHPMRPDVPREGLSHEDALAAAPEKESGGFSVPTFVES